MTPVKKIQEKNREKYTQKIINSKWKTPFEYQFKYLNTFHGGKILISNKDVEVNRETGSNFISPVAWTYSSSDTNQKLLEIFNLRPLLKQSH